MDCTENRDVCVLHFFPGSHTLFTGPVSTEFSKFFFKIGSQGIIYTFKNYFAIVFSVISFQFLAISGIQTDLKKQLNKGWFKKKIRQGTWERGVIEWRLKQMLKQQKNVLIQLQKPIVIKVELNY